MIGRAGREAISCKHHLNHGLRGFRDFTDKMLKRQMALHKISGIRVILFIRDADNGENLKELGFVG